MNRILVVEDDPMLAASLSRALRYEGYEVETAADGLAALDGARSNPPDLMVLDLMLPIMDGIEVCRRVRMQSGGAFWRRLPRTQPGLPARRANPRPDPARAPGLCHGAEGTGADGSDVRDAGARRWPPANGGPLLNWHKHEQVCYSLLPPGLAGLVDPQGMCPVGSIAITTTNWMMHAWTVPGAPQQFGDLDQVWKSNYLDSLSG